MPTKGATSLVVRGLSKSFARRDNGACEEILAGINLQVNKGMVLALFGPNGCGKTTLLNLIAGLDSADTGSVSLARSVNGGVRLGYAFQDFRQSLLPWKTAVSNVEFALRAIGISREDARGRARDFVDQNGFAFPIRNFPYQMSSGQQQSVALARVLVQRPVNLLLDEPFSALDHRIRFKMQSAVSSLVAGDTAVVLVSHDVDEALLMSDELVLLGGRPAKIIHRFPVPFPRPRERHLLLTSEFTLLRRDVLAAFLSEVEK